MTWGLATVVLSPQEFFAATRPVYFKCLPLLGVQSHIKLPWRTLPEVYQGIGLPNFGLHALAAKLQFIQCNWGFTDAASKGLSMGYESFIMNVGMYGNTLDLDYKSFSRLAVNGTWFKNVWELLHEFNVSATFSNDYQISPAWIGDSSLMGEFSKHYKGQDLIALNIFRMYKQVVHTSCIVLCNGHTIDKEFLTMTPGHSDGHKFPLQCPTISDWTLWKNALKRISSKYYTLSRQLGDFISSLHLPNKWMTTHDGHILHHSQNVNG